MTQREIDMEKLCPELAKYKHIFDTEETRDCIRIDRKNIYTIAATMLKLAEEKWEQADKFYNLFTHMKSNAMVSGQSYAKVTVALIDQILEQLEAARKGDGG